MLKFYIIIRNGLYRVMERNRKKKNEKEISMTQYGLTVSRVLSQEKGLYRRLVSTHGENGEKE